MSNRFQMISDNGGFLTPATIHLSTVGLPILPGVPAYESCLFGAGGASEVLAEYETLNEAIQGHNKLSKSLRLSR